MTNKDILEIFFEALERPQSTIVTEMLSGNLTNAPESDIMEANE